MSHTQPINAWMDYDEGQVEIRLIDAVIHFSIHAWGQPLNLSLKRDGADLLIVLNAPSTASTPTGESDTVTGQLSTPENIPSNQVEPVPPTSQ